MTVKEIAKLAGVSPATVSLVLNGKKGVGEEKRKEILRLLDENQYKGARKVTEKNKNILFIKYTKLGLILEENGSFITAVMDAAELECQRRNYKLTFTNCEGHLSSTLKALDYSNLYGLLILGTELEVVDYFSLKDIPIPYVVIDNSMPHFDCNCVSIDNRENVFKAVEYYTQQGVKEIGYFKGSQEVHNFTEREEGFYSANKYFGLKINEENIFVVPPSTLGAFEKTQEYINAGRKIPSCLFVDNDTMAIGVAKALTLAGYHIPEDISIIGFDDIPFAQIYSPTISTVFVDKKLLGTLSISALESTASDKTHKTIKTTISGHLILRQSTRYPHN